MIEDVYQRLKEGVVGLGNLVLTALATGFTITGGTTAEATLTVTADATVEGTNTGDQTITLTGDVTGSGTGSFATTIAPGVIVDADVNAAAAIAWTKVSKSGSSLADLATRSAADLGSGVLADARMPNLTGDVTTVEGAVATTLTNIPAISGVNLTNLNASNLASGTLPDARFPATLPVLSGVNLTGVVAVQGNLTGDVTSVGLATTLAVIPAISGVNLTNLNATNLASGTVADARLSANVVLENAANSFSLINPLTTIAESWIGPSSTAGMYFKGNNIGIGTALPTGKIHIHNNSASALYTIILTTDTAGRAFQINTTDYVLGSAGTSLRVGMGAGSGLTYAFFDNTDKGTAGAILVLNQTGGNVGIGTTTAPSKLTIAGLVNLKNYTVATLPAGTRGDIAYVTDALAPTFLAALVGGGAVVTPAFYNGAAWVGF